MNRVTKLELHNIIYNNRNSSTQTKKEAVYKHLIDKFKCKSDENIIKSIKSTLDCTFFNNYFVKWKKYNYCITNFLKMNSEWLKEEINFNVELNNITGKYNLITVILTLYFC